MTHRSVTIEKMTFGGSGLGHINGKVCFVPFTAPGDSATIRVVSDKRSYVQAELVDLITPSSLRVPPPCPVFGACGGCNWQHVAYVAQLAAKEEIFAGLLWRTGRVEPHLILPIVSAPQPYGYRSRVQLKVRFISGTLHLGFYRSGSHFVIDLPQRCAIAMPVPNHLANLLSRILLQLPEPDKIPQVDISTGDNGSAVLLFHYIGQHPGEIAAVLMQHSELTGETGLFLQTGRKETITMICGPDRLTYTVPSAALGGAPEVTLSFSAGGFSQVNYQQNTALIRTVLAWADLTGHETILDLYCGNGNFSIPLARFARKVTGIEEVESSINDAAFNCAANHVQNALYRCCDANNAVRAFIEAGERFDVVILDPPRTGAADLVRYIPSLKPARVIYISCDPATLGRDIGILKKLDYVVTKTMPVDMFPQTYHIESVTLFEPAEATR